MRVIKNSIASLEVIGPSSLIHYRLVEMIPCCGNTPGCHAARVGKCLGRGEFVDHTPSHSRTSFCLYGIEHWERV
jgi:hypothetical protein